MALTFRASRAIVVVLILIALVCVILWPNFRSRTNAEKQRQAAGVAREWKMIITAAKQYAVENAMGDQPVSYVSLIASGKLSSAPPLDKGLSAQSLVRDAGLRYDIVCPEICPQTQREAPLAFRQIFTPQVPVDSPVWQ